MILQCVLSTATGIAPKKLIQKTIDDTSAGLIVSHKVSFQRKNMLHLTKISLILVILCEVWYANVSAHTKGNDSNYKFLSLFFSLPILWQAPVLLPINIDSLQKFDKMYGQAVGKILLSQHIM